MWVYWILVKSCCWSLNSWREWLEFLYVKLLFCGTPVFFSFRLWAILFIVDIFLLCFCRWCEKIRWICNVAFGMIFWTPFDMCPCVIIKVCVSTSDIDIISFSIGAWHNYASLIIPKFWMSVIFTTIKIEFASGTPFPSCLCTKFVPITWIASFEVAMNSEEVPSVESNVAHWLTWKLMSVISAKCNCSHVSIFSSPFVFFLL